MKKSVSTALEVLPLVVFFAVYKFSDLIAATGALVVVTIVTISITYMVERRVPMMPLISAIVLSFFGGLTLISGDGIFIKIKPTLVNIVFASILFAGAYMKKPLLKYLMESAFKMDDEAWLKFSLRWGFFFLFLAGLNEVIWRNFSEDFWVKFKVFGMLPISVLFTATQIPFLKKNMIEEEEESLEVRKCKNGD